MEDLLAEHSRAQTAAIRWQIAASAHEPSVVGARYREMERSGRKEQGMDALMERLAADKRERAGLN